MKHSLRKYILAIVALLCLLCVALVGCSFNVEGTDGINGTDGKDGVDGKDGANGINGSNGTDGTNGIDGVNGQDGADGKDGINGSDGKDGTNIFIGYDGYIWQDDFRTDFKLDKDNTGNENVVEDTIGAYATMKYFEGSYIDTSKQIALMANYKPNVKITQYSGANVSEIQIVCQSAGVLYIGSAKVGDIVDARANGVSYTSNTSSYDVSEGINTIALNLTVAEDETIIIGGANSTAKIYIASIPINDEVGNYSILDNNKHSDILCKTNGYPDTVAIRVKAKSILSSSSDIDWNAHLEALCKKEEDEILKVELLHNLLKGKQLSVLGDSISTFSGVSNDASEGLSNNAVYYSSSRIARADTYWQQIVDEFDMNLCINNSWSGAYASMHRPNANTDKDSNGSISSGIARANKLAKSDGTAPDYILVYIGINDLNAGVAADVIATAYTQMLTTMTQTYPYAKVFCVNMPNRNIGKSPIAYNTAIANAIESVNANNGKENVFLVDLYNSYLRGATYQTYSFDNLHPNAVGMDYMSQAIIDTMKDALSNEFRKRYIKYL